MATLFMNAEFATASIKLESNLPYIMNKDTLARKDILLEHLYS